MSHFDTTPINKKAYVRKKGRAPAGRFPKDKSDESKTSQFNTGTAYQWYNSKDMGNHDIDTATWPGGEPMEGDYLDNTVNFLTPPN